MSIILMSEVAGRLSILLMKMVVITSIVVRFTLKAASKKKGLKKVVATVVARRRKEGKYVVMISLMNFRFKIINTLKPLLSSWKLNFQKVISNMFMSNFWLIEI